MAEKKICSKCDGKGWIPNPNVNPRDPNSPDSKTCDKCQGDGWT